MTRQASENPALAEFCFTMIYIIAGITGDFRHFNV